MYFSFETGVQQINDLSEFVSTVSGITEELENKIFWWASLKTKAPLLFLKQLP
jgi:hypothetical protein